MSVIYSGFTVHIHDCTGFPAVLFLVCTSLITFLSKTGIVDHRDRVIIIRYRQYHGDVLTAFVDVQGAVYLLYYEHDDRSSAYSTVTKIRTIRTSIVRDTGACISSKTACPVYFPIQWPFYIFSATVLLISQKEEKVLQFL